MTRHSVFRVKLAIASLAALLVLSGCRKYIDYVKVTPSQNLEAVRVELVFTQDVRSTLATSFALKDYGYLFLNPWTEQTRFSIGFELETSILNEQDYVILKPTEFLPNGMPLGTGYPVVQVGTPNPISDKFDLYAYVDVSQQKWLGTAAMFRFMSDKYFPENLVVSQVFSPDAEGRPAMVAHVFGPILNPDGTLKRAGGLALLANVKQLKAKTRRYRPYGEPILSGSAAVDFVGHPERMKMLEDHLVEGFNQSN